MGHCSPYGMVIWCQLKSLYRATIFKPQEGFSLTLVIVFAQTYRNVLMSAQNDTLDFV